MKQRLMPGLQVGALLLWLLLLLPALRHALEADMSRHMLVQIPLLVLVGCAWAGVVPPGLRHGLCDWNRGGITGLLLVSLWPMVWMLPRVMDAAFGTPWVEAAKFLGLPLLAGLPLALSWPRAGLVVRGLFLANLVSMLLLVGWLYQALPQQLCANYLQDQQQRLGTNLWWLAAVLALLTAVRVLVGGRPGQAVPGPSSDRA